MATVIYSVAGLSWLLAGQGESGFAIGARGFIAGIGAGGLLLIGQSMLPDTMAHDYRISGARREGVMAGVYTTVEKISFALGPALAGLLLGAAGYIQSPDPAVEQPAAAVTVIYVCAAIIPVATLAIGCLLLIGYDLKEETLETSRPQS